VIETLTMRGESVGTRAMLLKKQLHQSLSFGVIYRLPIPVRFYSRPTWFAKYAYIPTSRCSELSNCDVFLAVCSHL